MIFHRFYMFFYIYFQIFMKILKKSKILENFKNCFRENFKNKSYQEQVEKQNTFSLRPPKINISSFRRSFVSGFLHFHVNVADFIFFQTSSTQRVLQLLKNCLLQLFRNSFEFSKLGESGDFSFFHFQKNYIEK